MSIYKFYHINFFLYHKDSYLDEFRNNKQYNIIIFDKINEKSSNKFRRDYHDFVCQRRDFHFCFIGHNSIKNIKISITTFGGILFYSDIICGILDKHKGTKTVVVNYQALSAGTLIVLSCDSIIMDESSQLSPFDAQVRKYAIFGDVISYLKILEKPFSQNLLTIIMFYPFSLFLKYRNNLFIKKLRKKALKPFNEDLFMKLFLNSNISHHTQYSYADVNNIGLNLKTL